MSAATARAGASRIRASAASPARGPRARREESRWRLFDAPENADAAPEATAVLGQPITTIPSPPLDRPPPHVRRGLTTNFPPVPRAVNRRRAAVFEPASLCC